MSMGKSFSILRQCTVLSNTDTLSVFNCAPYCNFVLYADILPIKNGSACKIKPRFNPTDSFN